YDFGQRRPNEIHPDEKLGAAAIRAARPGSFPQGAQGAGRMTMQGSYFGLWLHSGQGGAFRQVGDSRIACFTVVNAVGAVVAGAGLHPTDLGTIASEVMWDAILNSIPTIPDLAAVCPDRLPMVPLGGAMGRYEFGRDLALEVTVAADGLRLRNVGRKEIFGI